MNVIVITLYGHQNKKNIRNKYPEASAYIDKLLESTAPAIENTEVFQFGQYDQYRIEDVVLNHPSYIKWLMKKDSFKEEYPKTYEKLSRYYDLLYNNEIIGDSIFLYVLKFKNRRYIKPGKTSQFIVRRIYNYAGITTVFYHDEIDIVNSFVYKTNDLKIEDDILKEFKEQRVSKRSERLNIDIKLVEKFVQFKAFNSDFYYLKKSLFDFIPYKSGFAFREDFILKINQFTAFEQLYIEHLKSKGLYKKYNPDFYGDILN